MDRALYDEVIQALNASELGEEEKGCVRAAIGGEASVESLLNGEDFECSPPGETVERAAEIFLTHIAVQGFRGAGPRSELTIDPKPGLTVVLGRNGTGKSSLAEGLEVVLGGLDDSQRWDGRDNEKEWRQGWRNLGWNGNIYTEAGFTGTAGRFVARRVWTAGDEDSEVCENIDAGWSRGVVEGDPVLTYAELGRLPETKATDRFKQLAHLLGLEGVSDARQLLSEQRKRIARTEKRLKSIIKDLHADLEGLDDTRARVALEALGETRWAQRAQALRAALGEKQEAAIDTDLARLKFLSQLVAPPDPSEHIANLKEALEQHASIAGTAEARLNQLAELLQRALQYAPEAEASDCPVCGTPGVLDTAWRVEAKRGLDEAKANGRKAQESEKQLAKATRAARQICTRPPTKLESEPCRDLWTDWGQGQQLSPEALLIHLQIHHAPLAEAVGTLVEDAKRQLAALDEAWRPVQARLQTLLAEMEGYLKERKRARPFGNAEMWLREFEEQLRKKRLKPISDRSKEIWNTLRHDSSVDLEDLVLGGRTDRPQIGLTVEVDGHEASALAVMSQGELNALSLALFLPRATQETSPFRFVVIDDPVQAMDPHKVDGLAKLLHQLAQDRQVVVFSHDYRLGEALRRLNLPANLVSVQRRERAKVIFEPTGTPVETYLSEIELAMSEKGRVGEDVARQVVPGLLRMTLEAHFTDHIRRRELATRSHAELSDLLSQVKGLTALASLAVGSETALSDWLPNGTDTLLSELATGAHKGSRRTLRALVRHTKRVLDKELP